MKTLRVFPNSPLIPECAALEQRNLPTPWSDDSIKNMGENGRYIAVLHDEKVVGICSYYLIIDELELCNIAVDKEYRKKGIGRMMMEKMLSEDFNVCSLEVEEDNIGAQEFYRTFGFREAGKRKNFYKNRDAVIMILQKEKEKC